MSNNSERKSDETGLHSPIYHLVTAIDLARDYEDPIYRPVSLTEHGFVHCALEPSVVGVANDYYADVDSPLLLLEIDAKKISSETRLEDPAPLEHGGRDHLKTSTLFPHVYGPIDDVAILRIGRMQEQATGFQWPVLWKEFCDWRSLVEN